MELRLGTEGDLEGWMELTAKVKDAFPGLETRAALEAHRETALGFMRRGEENELCFLAVDGACRRQHIGERMVSCMRTFLDQAKEVTVTTYREDVPEGAAARAFYKRLGFVEGKLTEEFGSPVQEFIWKP